MKQLQQRPHQYNCRTSSEEKGRSLFLSSSFFSRFLVAIAILGTGAVQSKAATVTWVGNTSNLWSVGSNWSTGSVPANGDSLVFGANGSAGIALSDDHATSPLVIGGSGTEGLSFGISAPGYTITRPGVQTLTLSTTGATGIKDLSLFNQSINTPILYSSAQTVQVGGTSGAALSQLTLGGAQTGGFRLTKTGNGTLLLNTTNTLGGLTVNGGIVSIGADTQLSAAPGSATPGWIVLDGGALRSNITSLTIATTRGITLGNSGVTGSGGTILVNQGTTVGSSGTIYNGIIANAGTANTLTKTGVGILALGGANTYTGATRVNQGQLTLDFSVSGAPTSNIISNSSTLVLGGVPNLLGNSSAGNPILYTQGSNSAATTQTFNGTTIDFGNGNVIAHAGSGSANTTIDLGTITHNVGGTVGFSTMTNGGAGVGVLKASNGVGMLGAWATIAAAAGTGTAALAQTDWAAVDVSGNIVAYTGYLTPTGAAPAIASNTATNLRLDGTSSGTSVLSAGTTDLNTILVSDPATPRQITVGAGNTLRLGASGGIWKTSVTNSVLNITGGTLTAGGTTTNNPGELVLNSGTGLAVTNATLNISSVIANNGTGAVSLVKAGAASIIITGANTYTGGTYVNQGTLSASNSLNTGVFGTGAVTIAPGAQVTLNSSATPKITYANAFNIAGTAINMNGNTISGDITLLGDSVITSTNTDGGQESGKISGDFGLTFTRGFHTLSNSGNDFSGNIGINASSPTAISVLLAANAGIKLGANDVLPNGAGKGNLIVAGTTTVTGTLDMNGKTDTINGLVSAGTAAGVTPLAVVTNTSATASTLTLGDNDQTATYAGTIVNGTGSVAITKIGTGTQIFSNNLNSYTGNTTVSNGTLALVSAAGNSTISGTPVIDVQSGAKLDVTGISFAGGFIVGSGQTLKGNGTIVGNTTVQGNLSPGASPGLLTFSNNLTLSGSPTVTMEIVGTSRGVAGGYDAINLATGGILNYDGTLSLSMASTIADGTYDLFAFNTTDTGTLDGVSFLGGAYSGTFINSGSDIWTAMSGGQSFSFSEATGDLTVIAAIPEPSTYALMAMAGMGFFCLHRFRRSSKVVAG